MNALFALVGAALPAVAAYLLLQPVRRAGASRLCTIALAIGAGLGIASCTFFLALVLFDGRRAGVIGIDAVLLACALAVWRRSGAPPASRPAPLSSSQRVLVVAVLVAAAGAALSFLATTLQDPHGRWDAWATWNLRARWLAEGGPAWRSAFAWPTVHGDYPLLLPATVARVWVYGGGHDPTVPAAVAAAYGVALVLLLYAALAALRGRTQALIGALCLLGTPVFLRLVAWQYADVPLAFNLLAVLTLLSLYDHDRASGRATLVWAGIAAGLAAWTKNEGWMLLLGVVLVRIGLIIARRAPVRSAGWFIAGLLPPAAIVLYFKLTCVSRSSPQVGRKVERMAGQLVDPARYDAILGAATSEIVAATTPILIALVVYAILLGRTRDQRARGLAAGVASIIGFAAVGYGVVYLTLRADLTWVLYHSIDRLTLHLWPSALLAALLYLASPPERAAVAARHESAAPLPAQPASRRQRRAGRR